MAPAAHQGTARGAAQPDADADAGGDLPSCERIEYRGESGTIYVQTDLDGYIQWGIYMHNPADDAGPWWVKVFVGKNKVDENKVDEKKPPRQVYAPHGRIHPNAAIPGRVLRFEARHVTTDRRESDSVTNGCLIP